MLTAVVNMTQDEGETTEMRLNRSTWGQKTTLSLPTSSAHDAKSFGSEEEQGGDQRRSSDQFERQRRAEVLEVLPSPGKVPAERDCFVSSMIC